MRIFGELLMKKRSLIINVCLGGVLLSLASALLVNYHLEKKYKPGDYVKEEDAYFVETIDDPAGLVKAHKFITPTDNKYSSQKTRSLGTSLIGDIESVWDSYTGKGTTVAIIDDGFDYNHPEYTRKDGSHAILSTSRYYYASGSNAYYKQYSTDPTCIAEDWEEDGDDSAWATHGTCTSTTAAAPINNGGGVGIAPEADILALKIDFSLVAIKAAISYAISQGVDVINMSLGAYAESFTDGWGDQQSGSSSTATYLNSVCQQAYNAGIIVVAAAGNESTWHKSYPACNTKVIGVGALGDWDNKGNANELAEFSNYVSSSQSGEINVDILAPGYVYTAHQKGTQSSPTHTYGDTQGTSFSCPIIAGAACLWKQKYPSGTPDEFLTQLQDTADGKGYYTNKMIKVSGWYSELSDVGPSNITNGRLNVANLLDISEPFVNVKQSSLNISIGETKQIEIETSNGDISYSIANTSIASVNSTGLVTGVAEGSTTLTVTATKDEDTASVNIPVTVNPIIACTSLSINPTTKSIEVGETYSIEPTITTVPSNATRAFLFASKNEGICTVDEDAGLVTAVSAGTTKIEIVCGYGSGDAELTITVTPKATPSTWNKVTSTSDITNGDYLIVYETGGKAFNGGLTSFDVSGNYISVSISNNTITYNETTAAARFTINSVTGGYTIKSASGYYIGRDTNSNGIDASTSTQYVNTINISSGNATIAGAGGKTLRFNTQSGQDKFKYLGGEQLVQLYKGAAGSTPSMVNVDGVTISKSTLSLTVGESSTLSATVSPSNATNKNVTWSSSNTDVASVSNGSVTALSAGTTTITVTTVDGGFTASCTVTVTSSGGGETGNYNHSFTYSEQGSGTGKTWSLTDCSDNSSFWLCPASGNSSVALFPGIFENKLITSAVTITINSATYGSGSNPSSTTYSVYNSSSCTVQVTASKSGSLPSSSSYTNAIYTVSQTNAVNNFTSDLALKIVKPGKQIRLKSVTVAFSYETTADKVVDSLSAVYSGSTIYVGDSFDESKVTVTASYTNSAKYPNSVLKSDDYIISGFSSEVAGTVPVTVTYTGSLSTSADPDALTTTFNVAVVTDTISNVNISLSKTTFHPGETISKSDISLTVTFASSRVLHPDDFTFASEGYRFQYSDANSGGTNTSKQFAVNYLGQNYNFEVNVTRVAYVAASSTTKTLTGAQGKDAGITGTGASGAANYSSLTINGVECAATNIYVYSKNGTQYFSFGKAAGEIHNKVALSKTITSLSIDELSGSRTDSVLYVSTNGTDWVKTSNANFNDNDYRYFKVAYEDSDSLYSNFNNINIGLKNNESPTNLANYIMFEDTNNQCVSKTGNALKYFNNLTSADKTTFMTSTDYVISTARERLIAWAKNQGKTISLVNGEYVVSSSNEMYLSNSTDNNLLIIFISISSTIVAASFALYCIRRRKHH